MSVLLPLISNVHLFHYVLRAGGNVKARTFTPLLKNKHMTLLVKDKVFAE